MSNGASVFWGPNLFEDDNADQKENDSAAAPFLIIQLWNARQL